MINRPSMPSPRGQKLRRIIIAALFAAIICVTTAYILHIPYGNGYIHLGDSFIYLAASLLPKPYAMLAAAIGGGLSDTLTGYYVYILPTLLIKPLNAFCFSSKGGKILTRRNMIAAVCSGLITAGGYYLADVVIYGSWAAALATLPGSLIQAGGSLAVYYAVSFALDKRKLYLGQK